MAMPMEANGSSEAGALTVLTVRLGRLRLSQNPEDLSKTLRSAFTEPELYKTYLFSLVTDQMRAKALLEVFDKVSSRNRYRSVK